MYRQGFDDVYHRVAQIPDNVPMNMRRVITKAIHRSSKPDLAIEVAMEAGRRGVDAVPTLLKKNVLTGAVAGPRSCRLISPPSSFTAAQSSPAAKQNLIDAKNGCPVANGFR